MVMVGADGKQREMVCLPAEQIPDWINSINANKVGEEKRQALQEIQKFFQYAINEFVRERYVTVDQMKEAMAEQALYFQRIIEDLTKAVIALQNNQSIYNDSEQVLASVGGKMMARARMTKPIRTLQ